MKANFLVQVQEAIFPAGTIGGSWLWQLVLTDGLAGPVVATTDVIEWLSPGTSTSQNVEPETTYKISVVRVDPNKDPLGPVQSASFTTEAAPVDVVIDVASSIIVDVVV